MELEISSLQHKLRSSVCCCFGGGSEERSPAAAAGDRCRGLVDRIKWRRRVAGEFRYDPLSYALNFDEGEEDDYGEVPGAAGEGFRYRSFSSRLPPSPPPVQRPTAIAIS